MPDAAVEVVELDPVVLEVAKEWFGFRPDDRLTVTLGDGLERICFLEKEGQRENKASGTLTEKKKSRYINKLTSDWVFFSFFTRWPFV